MPGDPGVTRMGGPYSMAAPAVMAATPALAAEYGASPGDGRVPLIDAVLTMLPRPADRLLGTAARMPLTTPFKLIRTMRSNSSGSQLWSGDMPPTPALL